MDKYIQEHIQRWRSVYGQIPIMKITQEWLDINTIIAVDWESFKIYAENNNLQKHVLLLEHPKDPDEIRMGSNPRTNLYLAVHYIGTWIAYKGH